MKFKSIVSTIFIAIMTLSPVMVNAGGAQRQNIYTSNVDGGTIKVGIMSGVVIDDKPDGVVGYEGKPTNINIPLKTEDLVPEEKGGYVPSYPVTLDILEDAFKDCSSLKNITLNGNRVYSHAFSNCSNLETVTFGGDYSHWTQIEENAFESCKSLKKIVVKSRLNTKTNAFKGCPIETVVLPEKYDNYKKPEKITNPDGSTSTVMVKDGVYFTYFVPDFSEFTELKTINIPYGTYSLDKNFVGCSSLENIKLPETIEYLSGAFKDCTSLKEITIPKSVESVSSGCFENCTALSKVTILGDETKIYKGTFENCPNVTVICNSSSKAAEVCIKNNIKAIDFSGNPISDGKADNNIGKSTSDNEDISVILNGSKLLFKQSPVIENGTTLVPMRAIFEAMGATVDWDNENKTVTSVKDSITIKLTLDNIIALVNDKEISLAVPAKLINGNTMVPLRFISESLGAEVKWDGESKTVIINE